MLLSEGPSDPFTDASSDLVLLARLPTDAGWYRVEMTTLPQGIRITRAAPEHGTS